MRAVFDRAFAPRDAASLAAFRIAFGTLMAIAVVRYFAHGWIDLFFVTPRFFFPYPGLEWIVPFPAAGMRALFLVLGVLALCIAAGFHYRASAALFCLGFTYAHLIDRTNYLNHYYLISLVSLLLVFVPAHRAWSFDAWRRPALRSERAPAWAIWVLRFQLGVVYVFGAAAKLNPDWLLHAQPLRIWLAASGDLQLLGPWLERPSVAYAAGYAGLLFDASIVAFLLWPRTRRRAYGAVVVFHLLTAALFPIGMFPWLMIGLTPIFFSPSWPRRFIGARRAGRHRFEAPRAGREAAARGATLSLLAGYALLQIALPLRHVARGGNLYWREDGFRFSWQIMVMEKYGRAGFRVTDPERRRTWRVSPAELLTPFQVTMMATQPDMIRSFARRLADVERRRLGRPVEVRVDAFVTLNGRPHQRLIDPNVDLAKPALRTEWILPLGG